MTEPKTWGSITARDPILMYYHDGIPKHVIKRLASQVRAVWAVIPLLDRTLIMDRAIERLGRLQLLLSREPLRNTFACVFSHGCELRVDSWFVERSSTRLVVAALAHEFGHLRAMADPKMPSRSEAAANRFVKEWQFQRGDVVFKSRSCLQLDKIAYRRGIMGSVFVSRIHVFDKGCNTYMLIKNGEYFDLGCTLCSRELGNDVEEAKKNLRYYDADCNFRPEWVA